MVFRLALFIGLLACRTQAHQEGKRAHSTADARGLRSTVDSSTAPVPAPIENSGDSLTRTMHAINTLIPAAVRSDWTVISTAENRKERLSWLARDFGAPVFRRAEQMGEARLLRPDLPLHIGVLAIRFGHCRALAEATAKVERSGRQNFALPVLTFFRLHPQGRDLVFVFSETPTHPSAAALLGDPHAVLGPALPCH